MNTLQILNDRYCKYVEENVVQEILIEEELSNHYAKLLKKCRMFLEHSNKPEDISNVLHCTIEILQQKQFLFNKINASLGNRIDRLLAQHESIQAQIKSISQSQANTIHKLLPQRKVVAPQALAMNNNNNSNNNCHNVNTIAHASLPVQIYVINCKTSSCSTDVAESGVKIRQTRSNETRRSCGNFVSGIKTTTQCLGLRMRKQINDGGYPAPLPAPILLSNSNINTTNHGSNSVSSDINISLENFGVGFNVINKEKKLNKVNTLNKQTATVMNKINITNNGLTGINYNSTDSKLMFATGIKWDNISIDNTVNQCNLSNNISINGGGGSLVSIDPELGQIQLKGAVTPTVNVMQTQVQAKRAKIAKIAKMADLAQRLKLISCHDNSDVAGLQLPSRDIIETLNGVHVNHADNLKAVQPVGTHGIQGNQGIGTPVKNTNTMCVNINASNHDYSSNHSFLLSFEKYQSLLNNTLTKTNCNTSQVETVVSPVDTPIKNFRALKASTLSASNKIPGSITEVITKTDKQTNMQTHPEIAQLNCKQTTFTTHKSIPIATKKINVGIDVRKNINIAADIDTRSGHGVKTELELESELHLKGATNSKLKTRKLKSKDKKFQCLQCGKKYKVEKNFLLHVRIHDGEGFECRFCHKLFPRRQNMREHERIQLSMSINYFVSRTYTTIALFAFACQNCVL